MKKFVVILFVLLSSGLVLAQANATKLGYVNSQVIFEQFPEAIKAQSDLDALVSQWRTKLDSMETDLRTTYQNYQKQAGTMTPQKLKEVEQELAMLQQNIQQYQQEKFGQQPPGELYVKQEEMLAPIRKKIREAIDAIAQQEGISFVFDKTENLPVLLYADDGADITYQVLDKLKRGK